LIGQIEEDVLILGVVRDVDDLIDEEPRVDRVAHRAEAHDPVPGFHVPVGVPGQRGRDVTLADAELLECLRAALRAKVQVLVRVFVDRTFDTTADDQLLRMVDVGEVEHARHDERPVLHQSLHESHLGIALSLASARS
jgi:hypothetical protein